VNKEKQHIPQVKFNVTGYYIASILFQIAAYSRYIELLDEYVCSDTEEEVAAVYVFCNIRFLYRLIAQHQWHIL